MVFAYSPLHPTSPPPMLAAVPSARHPADPTSRPLDVPMAYAPDDERLCAGCAQSVNSETGGVVIAFGNSLWHVDW